MKKRIIAILLSVSVFCLSLSIGRRASAAGVGSIVAIASIGTLAFSVFSLITSGQAEKIADDVYEWIEYTAKPGMEVAFTGDGSWLATGYNQIFQTIKGWFDNGELEIVDGRVKLTYDQYMLLYHQVISTASKPDIDFEADFECYFLSVDLSNPIALEDLPHYNSFFASDHGEAYAPVYYNDERIVFADYFINTNCIPRGDNSFYSTWTAYGNVVLPNSVSSKCHRGGFISYDSLLAEQPLFYMPSLSTFQWTFEYYGTHTDVYNSTNCYVYENGKLKYTPNSDVDVSGMTSGLVTTSGTSDYALFLKSLRGYIPSLVPPDNLDDLSGVLPTEYNPSLTFPVNPDLTRPLPNQVIVGDIPGVADLPLSDYQAEIKTEIDVPSIICTKFPFCIPYDFMRFLGLLCSDPVAPVFRIPISTNPENLEHWKGNQTIGEYLSPSEPMFEIDEEIVIDLSVIPLVQPLCYTCFIVGFIFLLLHITPNMIQH